MRLSSFDDLKVYWVSRRLLLRFGFQVRRFFYSWLEKIRGGGHATSIVLTLVRNVWQVALASVVTVAVLQLAEYTCHKYLSPVLGYLPGWSVQVIQSLRDVIQPDKDLIGQFLGTVAGVAGVFLGLYFAAISVVAGSMFANVPGVIREQLVREKAGNLYVKGLALLTSTSILLLGYQSIGGMPGILNLLLVIGLSLFGVLSFLLLGMRVFNFFDYYELARPIFADLYGEIRHATTKGFAWDNEHFQAHYQKMASKHLRSLRVFFQSVLLTKEKEEEPLVNLTHRLTYLLSSYQKDKRLIPTNSKWYEATLIHQNWFLADSSALTVALNTHVGLQPKPQPNLYWFEEDVCATLQVAFSDVLSGGRVQTAYRMLQPLSDLLEICGEEFAFEEASKVITLLNSQVVSDTKKLDKEAANRILSNDHTLALVDFHGYCILNFVLGFFSGLRANESQVFELRLSRISWRNRKSIYDQNFPCSMLSRLEFVQRTTSFEDRVEGRSISPQWYRNQLVAMQYMHLLSSGFLRLVELLSAEFVEISKTYLERGQVVFAAMHAHRGLEVCDKIHYHIAQNKERVVSFNKTRILHELPWPDWDWDKLHDDVRTRRESLVDMLAQCLPALAVLDRPVDAPDVFGQSYNTVYAHVMLLLEQNRGDEFGRMFPQLFVGVMLAYDKLQKEQEIIKADVQSKLVFGSEPIIDILDLSGYAKIYSELYLNSKLWDVCESTWNKYLDSHPKASELIKYFVSVVQYRESLHSIIPRDVLRTNWEIHLRRTLRKENMIDNFGRGGFYGDDDVPLEHRSPLIRALCFGRHEPFVSAVEVFILTYLLNRPEANGVEFNDNHDFLEHLADEMRKQNPQSAGQEEDR